jgi:hypothetical protein
MSDWYAPNQQAVRGDGSGPAEEGSGGSAPVEPEPTAKSTGGDFDPAEHTVAEVEAYLAEHPDQSDAVLAAEAQGKNRATLTGG